MPAAGIHHPTFYRWRRRVQVPVRARSWADRRLEELIVAKALALAHLGPQVVVDELGRNGVTVTSSKVWRTLKAHRLNTRVLRRALLDQHRREPSIQVSPRAGRFVGRLDAVLPEDLVQMDCFRVGSFKETRLGAAKHTHGQIWQYTAIDVASSWTWAELHTTARNPAPAITSALAHRVATDLTRWG